MEAIGHALMMSFTMAWKILWALILDLDPWLQPPAVVQAIVSKEEMSRLPPDDQPGTIVKACGLEAASSSCSILPYPIKQGRGSHITRPGAIHRISRIATP